jgi:hypothetical protein
VGFSWSPQVVRDSPELGENPVNDRLLTGKRPDDDSSFAGYPDMLAVDATPNRQCIASLKSVDTVLHRAKGITRRLARVLVITIEGDEVFGHLNPFLCITSSHLDKAQQRIRSQAWTVSYLARIGFLPGRSGRYKHGLEGIVGEPDGLGQGFAVLVDHGGGITRCK